MVGLKGVSYFATFFLILSLLSISTLAQGETYHLKLLAVQENQDGNFTGSDADLYLELREGTGRVFLDTYPLTKIDTQISTRFAKEIACKHYKLNCDRYDFIYTIKARSSIIGGPSAGAAMAALTAIAVMDLPYRQDVAITGTINSGATIGPVGGLKEKIEAASSAHLDKGLIPIGTAEQEEPSLSGNLTQGNISISVNSNSSLNLIEYGKDQLNLQVIEVSDLDEVLYQITGRILNPDGFEIKIDPEYQQVMSFLKDTLCERNNKIIQDMKEDGIVVSENMSTLLKEKQELIDNSTLKKEYYSAASYCFSNNIALKFEYYNQSKTKIETINTVFSYLDQQVSDFEQEVNQENITTLTDLQALMIVKERLADVQQQIDTFQKNKANLSLEEMYYLLAYSEERYFSAISWREFFKMEGKEFVLNEESLSNSCQQKILEAEERIQYVSIYLEETDLGSLPEQLNFAKESAQKKEFSLCLMQATQTKAQADAILSSIGVSEKSVSHSLQSKSKAVQKVIAEANKEEMFPILGYSYYQYANSLKESQPFAAMVYYEYALEMSDLSLYFPEQVESNKGVSNWFSNQAWELFVIGVLVGISLAVLVLIIRNLHLKSKSPSLKRIKAKK